MSNEKFKVKFGLAVGDTIATIDATTGDIDTDGRIVAASGADGQVVIEAGPGNNGKIEIGLPGRTTAGSSYIDFHSSANSPDYDVRVISSGGSATPGTGTLTIEAATVDINGDLITNGITAGNISIGVATDNTIASTDTNGVITLDPNGTGNVVMTFANGGNLTNDRNYLFGAVRDTTTLNNGNIYALQSTISPTRGISLSNSDSPSSYRPGVMMRSYSGGASAPRGWIVFENARGTVASPTAIQNNDKFCEIMAQGYNGTNWSGDQVLGTPFLFRASATEAWASSPARAGTKLEVICQPAGVTYTASTPMNIIDHGPTAATYRADTWDFRTRTTAGGGTNISQLSLDVSGNAILAGDLRINGNDIQASDGLTNITLNSNTSTTFAGNAIVTGDIRINGNDIQASDGNTNITLNSNLSTTFAGDIRINGNDIRNSNDQIAISMTPDRSFTNIYTDNMTINSAAGKLFSNIIESSGKVTQILTQNRATSSTDFATSSWNTYRSTDSINYTPTQSGDVIGEFKFNGNANTSTTPGVPGAPGGNVVVSATENWTSTANGSQMNFFAIKQGTLDSYNIISANPTGTEFIADTFAFKSATTGTPGVTGNNITYNRVYGQWQYDTTITPAASNTAYAFPIASGVTDFANIASTGSTSRIIPGAAGMYKLQFSVQVQNDDSSSEHIAYFWWRKNGTDVPGSMGQVGVFKATGAVNGLTIAGWDNMISSANTTDYWELMYAVDDATHIDFPAFGTTAFGPATAALFITLVPVGA